MNHTLRLFGCITLSGLALLGSAARADWALDNNASRLSFVSIKATNVGEVHHFKQLSGSIDDQGDALVEIALASVATNIDIRDERMREILLATDLFPAATVRARIDIEAVTGLAAGESIQGDLQATLTLKDKPIPFTVPVLATRSGPDALLVTSLQPVILSAEQLGLTEGVEKLREIAGLPNISQAVPVSFVLSFRAAQP